MTCVSASIYSECSTSFCCIAEISLQRFHWLAVFPSPSIVNYASQCQWPVLLIHTHGQSCSHPMTISCRARSSRKQVRDECPSLSQSARCMISDGDHMLIHSRTAHNLREGGGGTAGDIPRRLTTAGERTTLRTYPGQME